MSLPPTLIIDDRDEERTRVDTRARPSRNRRWFSKPLRLSLGGVGASVVLIVAGASAAVAYRQWRAVDELREAVADLEAYVQAGFHQAKGLREPADASVRDVGSGFREVGVEERELLERRGAELLASNDFDSALAHYRKLAALAPGERAFRDVVSILEARLGCGSECP